MKAQINKNIKQLIYSLLFIVLGIAIGRGAVLGYNHFTQVPLVEYGNYDKYFTNKKVKIVLFGTSWCKYCQNARQLLDDENIEYIDNDVENNDIAMNEFKELDGKGYPLLLIGNTRINGFNRIAILETLNKP